MRSESSIAVEGNDFSGREQARDYSVALINVTTIPYDTSEQSWSNG